MPFAASGFEGTAYSSPDGTITFNNTGAVGSLSDPETGTFSGGDTVIFEWYVEAATCLGCDYNYLVIYSDSVIDPSLPVGVSFRDTRALLGTSTGIGVAGSVYSFEIYTEQSNFSDADRATGSDGEIWSWDETL
jgi:hypothetical protein